MYQIIDVEQGSDDWHKLRLGKWGGSSFSKILSPTGKPSTQKAKHEHKLIAQLLTGEVDDFFKTEAMDRGNELEADALSFVNFTMGHNFEPVGYMLAMDGDRELGYGVSPDAVDFDRQIGLEIKSPLAHTQIGYLLKGELPMEYYPQIQGSLMVSGFKEWVFCAYHPTLKPLILTVKRNEEYITELRSLVEKSCKFINESVKKLEV